MKSQCYAPSLSSRKKIKSILNADESIIGQTVVVCGWIRTLRDQKTFAFIELTDGSSFSNFQVIAQIDMIENLSTGAAVAISGEIVKSPGNKQKYEMQAKELKLIGACPNDYPLQKKRHSFDFLRTIAHLRPRTNTQGAVARVRSRLAYTTHRFFQEKGYVYLQSPIITGSDCEGAGEMFQVTTLNLDNPPKTKEGKVDYSKDFFSQPTFLTVSGQLNGEAYATALSDIYTFGPTFRAENSHTSRHLAEFWMIEPELAFADLPMITDLAEEYLKALVGDILDNCEEDLQFFNQFIEKGLIDRLTHVKNVPFARLTYTKAVEILEKSGRSFEYPVKWGSDLQSEHERYIAEEHCKAPVILTDYPKEIKAFYMRENDDGKTVAALDVLVPKVGEIIGGSQREERYDLLKSKFENHGLDIETYKWYLDLRKYGSVPHGGFGLGFERLVQFTTGVDNIRDAIAFPRIPGSCDF
ncbi:MAG: asparagine--tRNA ligase [Simkaniaceae bacterium]|nr:MAG: asparagine--tRNA ligase [Simkaniaceae bacterium]QVL55413.1 MAG: asparagine--tRNA ligase [Simkaniaceae bacterium]